MRYAEYHKEIARLDKEIAECLRREARAAGGSPWYYRVMPSLAAKAIEESAARRTKLARSRAKLERDVFGAASLLWNADPVAVFRRTVPASDEGIERLRAAADAAFEQQK
ncbi:hypothetical protein [Rhizomicrobium electricum]|nr:hypothetical protein [Rhizomicrobium electricum]NIJ48877.1 hypothetical protein [Rhizomicrobium electricum]